MLRQTGMSICWVAMLFVGSLANAQQVDIEELKKNVNILSGVLLEGLELNETPGLFGINEGAVDSVYLQGQGVLMEIQTPLAKRRNRVSLSALASAIQDLPGRSNPFAVVRRPDVPPSTRTMALSLEQDSETDSYSNLIEEIQAIDFNAFVDNSIRQANSSARSLRELGELDQETFDKLQVQLYSMKEDLGLLRQNMMQHINELRQMNSDSTAESAAATEELDGPVKSELTENIESLKVAVEQLKTNAANTAAKLSDQYTAAKAQYEEQWVAEVKAMEYSLYGLLCDYGATLRNLPEDEHLTIVLKDLGEESEDEIRTDKIHVLSKADLSQCQAGDLDAAALEQRSISYNY